MKKIQKYGFWALVACLMTFVGCSKENVSTDQFPTDDVYVVAYGPLPVARGGELRFMGSYLHSVTEVLIPGVDEPITDIRIIKTGNPSEIRITVPKEGPVPGTVWLKTSSHKRISAGTEISYTEPIELTSFAPASVMPGDELTITGDYLNLIQEVIFAEEVIVPASEFTAQSRHEIKVIVPDNARTGVIGIGDLDETDEANADLIPNRIFSDDELEVGGPEVTGETAERYKAGETITITGKNFQFVDYIKMQNADVYKADGDSDGFTVNAQGTEITFTIPAEAQDGEYYLVALSGVEIPVAEFECVKPSELAVDKEPIKAGDTLTITGEDLDLVAGITLPNVETVWEFDGTDDSISIEIPDTAQEGEITLTMANGQTVGVEYTLVKPEFASYSENPIGAGSQLTITGTDLDLVKSITFGGDQKVDVEASETEITVGVPTLAETGALKMNLANGTYVEFESLEITKPDGCYIIELPEEGTEIFGGTVLVVAVENGDKLEEVKVNGETVNFLLNGSSLYISLPDSAGAGTVITLVSGDVVLDYVIDCIPNTIQKKVIWSGLFDAGSWAGNQDLAWGAFDWTTVTPGSTLLLEFTEDASAEWWQIQLRHGQDWGQLVEPVHLDLEAGQTSAEIVLTEANLQDIIDNGGLVITGCNYILSKITLITEISLEVVVWEGSEDSGASCGLNLEIGEELAWANAGMKEGAKVRVYFTTSDPDWKVQIFGGHWEKFFLDDGSEALSGGGPAFDASNWDSSLGYVEFTASGEIYSAMTVQQWWGSALILQGNNVTFTKFAFL